MSNACASSSAGRTATALKRIWQQIPLHRLSQGSTLTIRSHLSLQHPTHITFQPAWRNTGHVDFQQIFATKVSGGGGGTGGGGGGNRIDQDEHSMVDIIVNQHGDSETMTSLGRLAAHVSIDLRYKPVLAVQQSGANDSARAALSSNESPMATFLNQAIPHMPSTPTTRVILDDGSIRPSDEYGIVNDADNSDTFATGTLSLATTSHFRRTDYHDGIAHIAQVPHARRSIPADAGSRTRHASIPQPSTEQQQQQPTLLPGTYITVHIPEKTNLDCSLQHGSITVTNKVEGDIQLSTMHGNISVTKLRGHSVQLHCGSTDTGAADQTSTDRPSHSQIYIAQLVEAQTIDISTPGRVRAKQLHGHTISVHVVDDRNAAADATATPTSDNNSESGFIPPSPSPSPNTDSDDEGSLVDISSLFVSGSGNNSGGASVSVVQSRMDAAGSQRQERRAIRIKSHHGPLQVSCIGGRRPYAINPYTDTVYPLVELGGVNGSCEVCIKKTMDSIDFNDDNDGDDDNTATTPPWSSCAVHIDSLSPDSVSLVTADRGHVAITMDRKVESDLRLASLNDTECVREAAALLAEEEDASLLTNVLQHLPRKTSDSRGAKGESDIVIDTKAFTLRPENSFTTETITYIDGWVENKSDEPDSRFDRKVRGLDNAATATAPTSLRGAGKIRHDSAQEQALYSFSEQSGDAPETTTINESHDSAVAADKARPLLAVVAGTGQVSVETVSWLGAIARRYGLDPSMDHNRDLGRTASRRGRPLVSRTE